MTIPRQDEGASLPVCAVQIVPGARGRMRDLPALETAMSGLVLDREHPVALELAGQATASGTRRCFIARSTSQATLRHVRDQLQARYPQATISNLTATDDPLRSLAPHEAVTCITLRPGAPAYLPLKTWKARDLLEEGADPVLGLLAALNGLPEHHRAVAHLVLTPAPATWSRTSQRLAQQHPLEPERVARQSQSRESSGGHGIDVLLLGLLTLTVVLGQHFWTPLHRILPGWVWQAVNTLLHGKPLHLTTTQTWQVGLAGAVVLACCLLVFILIDQVLLRLFGARTLIYDQQLVRHKTERIAYRACLRLVVIGPAQGREGEDLAAARRAIADRLIAAYRVYHLASGGSFVPRRVPQWLARLRLLETRAWWKPLFPWYQGVRRSPLLLTPEEVASLFHLPGGADLGEVTFLERGGARSLPVPYILTTGAGWQIGTNVHAGQRSPVSLPPGSTRYNALAVAGTGKGKSTLFQHLARVVLTAGTSHSLIAVDPHGDLALALCGQIDPARVDDVIVLDLANRAAPPAINPLDMSAGQDRDKVVDTLITIFEHIWARNWGSRIENTLQYALLTVCEANQHLIAQDLHMGPGRQYTLLSIIPLLQDHTTRKAILAHVDDPDIQRWWKTYYQRLGKDEQLEVAASIITKLSKFGASRLVRRIVGQPCSSINFAEILRGGKILLINTASGVIGEDTSALCGATLLGLLHTAIAEQGALPAEARASTYVLIDEIHTFVGVDFNAMLSELRKYGGQFALATQSFGYLDALDPTLRHSLLANTDHLFAFDMSAQDAYVMCRELGGGLEVEDLLTLDNFQCYAALSYQGSRLPVFSLTLDAPPLSDPVQGAQIRATSARRYAQPVEAVDALIAERAEAPMPDPSREEEVSQRETPRTPKTPRAPRTKAPPESRPLEQDAGRKEEA